MADIDYAFLADYAKVDLNGTLTSVGASWTYVTASVFPTSHRMAIAGRVKCRLAEAPVTLRITVSGPDESFSLSTDAQLTPDGATRPYAGDRVGLLFALDLQVPLPQEGLYEVLVELPSEAQVRRLAFEAVKPTRES